MIGKVVISSPVLPTSYKEGDKVNVSPHFWGGDTTYDCLSVPGVVVGVDKSVDQYLVKLLQDAGHGWYAGDTYRCRFSKLSPL